MSIECTKCHHLRPSCQQLTCGHNVCQQCLLVSQFSQQFAVLCPACSIITILRGNDSNPDVNPENYVVCIQCKSQIMGTREFLNSTHRKHDVVSVANIVHDVQKNLRKFQLSFDLENQALYSQAQSLSKQKRILSDNYAKNLLSLRQSFATIKQTLQTCERSCIQTYQKLAFDAVSIYDNKIKDLKVQMLKCESYVGAIQHSLIKNNGSKYVAATQFYFRYVDHLESGLHTLIQSRKDMFGDLGATVAQIKAPNLKPIQSLEFELRGLCMEIWRDHEQEKENKLSSSFQSFQKNPENEVLSYFEQKRRQIFSNSAQQNSQSSANTSIQQGSRNEKPSRNSTAMSPTCSKVSKVSKLQTKTNESYNIDGRIQHLRKTLRLGENKNNCRSPTLLGFSIK